MHERCFLITLKPVRGMPLMQHKFLHHAEEHRGFGWMRRAEATVAVQ